jgi:hypothetical protein
MIRTVTIAAFLLLLAAGFSIAQIDRSPVANDVLQVKQLGTLANDPKSIEDKLFVLWEYAGALRERELAKIVLNKATDPEVKALAILVRDGHQAGINTMEPIAHELGIVLPDGPTRTELAAIEAAGALPPADLERFFLRRQRAMHAWDITVFEDFGAVAANESLKRYVNETRVPLRDHAATVVRLANNRGIPGGLTAIQGRP